MAKFNFKQAAVNHTEKVVFGIIMLFVLWGLVSTDWSAYKGTPHEILVKVSQCKTNIQQAVWPEEEKTLYELTDLNRPATAVRGELFASINAGDYEASTQIFADGLAPKKPLTEIEKNAPEQMIASDGRVLIEILPPEEESEDDPTLALASEPMEEDDPNVPDEFRKRKNNPLGGPAGYPGMEEGMGDYYAPDAFGDPYGGMSPDEYASGPANYPGSEGSLLSGESGYPGYPGMGGPGMTVQKKDAKGYPFVSVRAVFRVRDQISKFAEAMNVSYHEAARYFYIIDFELQRQVALPGDDQWSEWEKVDIQVAEDILNETAGFDAETVSSVITDPVITMPLPMRVSGAWKTQATHPAIAKFELSPEQIETELELNQLMIQQALKQRKAVKETAVQRGGFSGHQFGASEVTSGLMGMDSMYDSSYAMSGSSYGMSGPGSGYAMQSSGMTPPGMGGGGVRPGRTPRGAAAKGQEPQRLNELLDQLVDKEDKERRERLSKWIQERAKAEGELLLFRYLDFSVAPGKTYRYRVRFVIPNPNFGRRIADAGGEAAVVQGKTRETDWSNVTEPATVKPDVQYFLASVKAPTFHRYSSLFPTASWDVYQYDHAFGTTMNSKLELRLGQKVGDKVTTEVIKPAEQSYEREEYDFHSEDFVVGILDDLPLDADFHSSDPDTKVEGIKGARGQTSTQGQALVMTSEGVRIFDGFSDSKEKKDMADYLDLQTRYYADIKERKEQASLLGGGEAGDPYNPYGAEGGEGMGYPGMDMMGYPGMGGPRQRNVLRKSSKSKSKSKRGAMSPYGAGGP
ncbi:MAG: hypothetical protein KDA69_09405 [Planctomycetaceae bacterium]|nr:hypothetical protein [Planctomycetaceae bacterium]